MVSIEVTSISTHPALRTFSMLSLKHYHTHTHAQKTELMIFIASEYMWKVNNPPHRKASHWGRDQGHGVPRQLAHSNVRNVTTINNKHHQREGGCGWGWYGKLDSLGYRQTQSKNIPRILQAFMLKKLDSVVQSVWRFISNTAEWEVSADTKCSKSLIFFLEQNVCNSLAGEWLQVVSITVCNDMLFQIAFIRKNR